jgi:hypothetical protein
MHPPHLIRHDHQAAVPQGLDVLVLLAVLQAQDLTGGARMAVCEAKPGG